MKELDFKPEKSGEDFRKNYAMHDSAEAVGKNLLTQWGFEFKEFGGDRRFEKVWEKGEDKPDVIITYKGKSVFIDWKAKRKPVWLMNERAVLAYEKWSSIYSLNVIVCFFVFDEKMSLTDKRFAFIGKHEFIKSESKQWDKNITVEFPVDIPEFTKTNLINHLLKG